MRGILADNDVEGVLDILTRIWLSDAWRDPWDELGCALETFDSLGLSRDAPDSLVWSTCQSRGVVLITGNRNAESPESLEATIRRSNQPSHLPVFTLANPRRFFEIGSMPSW